MKVCPTCKTEKPLNSFGRDRSRKDGLRSVCRQCRSFTEKQKRKTDTNFKISRNLRDRIYGTIKRNYKSRATSELLGCTIDDFKIHLASQFKTGMTWDNYSEWHVDHILPCAVFDLSCPEQQRQCFHYSNLRSLWRLDNLIKSTKYKE